MAKKKTTPKPKEAVRLRFKNLANGNQSIYLDCYVNGQRSYEFLKLYLIPPTDPQAKAMNANTLQAANAIKAQRIIEIANGQAGLKSAAQRGNMPLVDWMAYFAEQKALHGQSKSNSEVIMATRKLLLGYAGAKVMMKAVDKDFCLGFIEYMKSTKTKYGQYYAPTSIRAMFRCFGAALAMAVEEDVITKNPTRLLSREERVKVPDVKRGFLTVEEVEALIANDEVREDVKRAFLFSCFCGLRISDVKRLTWGDIRHDGKQWQAKIVMRKTKQALYLPLSADAYNWLPQRNGAADSDTVFVLPTTPIINKWVSRWSKAAGITQKVTFHLARHTFATLALSADVDIYTVSSLLGHTKIETTQIYAKIVDSKKAEAVNKLAKLFDKKI